jgi:hypothetical protein
MLGTASPARLPRVELQHVLVAAFLVSVTCPY